MKRKIFRKLPSIPLKKDQRRHNVTFTLVGEEIDLYYEIKETIGRQFTRLFVVAMEEYLDLLKEEEQCNSQKQKSRNT